ncbi:GerAB/ArcD/ProY family transporter [Paenibacillus pasadenensis]|uniref:Spore germination protein XB n=1 Tax=Paenibacillus pasadenensis TaxID=217090 RepID=A0A2N5NBM1_9BACL|nr:MULTISPECIES: GerAB/ArcD/ProY family transporter [Paenibacillus]PLT47660.1 Spore germination protein XB [Paenibacillus pasadenensis]
MPISNRISVWTCIIMLLLSSGGVANILVPPFIFSRSGSDSWVAILLALPPMLLWCGLLCYVIRKLNGVPIEQWLSDRFGRAASWTMRALVVVLLLLQASTLSWETAHIAIHSYMSHTPVWIIAGATAALCAWTASGGLRSIAYACVILVPIAVILDSLLLMLNWPNMDSRMLLPILENGISPALKGMPLAAAAMLEIWLVLFVQQHVKGRFRWYQFALLVLFLCWLQLIPVVVSICVFGSDQAFKLRSPVLEIWKVISLGPTIEHIDLFAIVQRVSSTFARISLLFYLSARLGPVRGRRGLTIFFVGMAAVVTAFSSSKVTDSELFFFLIEYQYPVFIAFVPALTALLAILLRWRSPLPTAGKEAEPG